MFNYGYFLFLETLKQEKEIFKTLLVSSQYDHFSQSYSPLKKTQKNIYRYRYIVTIIIFESVLIYLG